MALLAGVRRNRKRASSCARSKRPESGSPRSRMRERKSVFPSSFGKSRLDRDRPDSSGVQSSTRRPLSLRHLSDNLSARFAWRGVPSSWRRHAVRCSSRLERFRHDVEEPGADSCTLELPRSAKRALARRASLRGLTPNCEIGTARRAAFTGEPHRITRFLAIVKVALRHRGEDSPTRAGHITNAFVELPLDEPRNNTTFWPSSALRRWHATSISRT